MGDIPGLRPTPARIRETVFNWLGPSIIGVRCLDPFAGTGALGLEALSRGAATAVFVERSHRARQLQENIDVLGARGVTVANQEALAYLRSASGQRFDIVFLDPPFADDLLDETCRLLAQQQLLSEGALVYLEQDRSSPEPALPDDWQVIKNKTAGKVRYMLIQTGA